MYVLHLSQDFLGINFEHIAFQRTEYEFVCYVLFTTYLHHTAFRHFGRNDFLLYCEMIVIIYLNEIHMKI